MNDIAPIVTGTSPLFVSVIVCAVLLAPAAVVGKVNVAGLKLTDGIAAEPDRATVAEPPLLALFGIVSVAVSLPAVAESKLTEAVHVAPTASVAPQVVVSANALALLPEIAICPSVSDIVPVFDKVTTSDVLATPVADRGKLSELGLTDSCARVAVPDSATVAVPFVVESVAIESVAL